VSSECSTIRQERWWQKFKRVIAKREEQYPRDVSKFSQTHSSEVARSEVPYKSLPISRLVIHNEFIYQPLSDKKTASKCLGPFARPESNWSQQPTLKSFQVNPIAGTSHRLSQELKFR
jgi:hypothetical protein